VSYHSRGLITAYINLIYEYPSDSLIYSNELNISLVEGHTLSCCLRWSGCNLREKLKVMATGLPLFA
jgi:hypothetical protein